MCALSEARAHALAAARTPADRSALLGDDEVQLWMEQLEDRMITIASNAGRWVGRCGWGWEWEWGRLGICELQCMLLPSHS